jgi:Cu/Ag efflux protein CusF
MPHKVLSILLLAVALCACKNKPVERHNLDGVVVGLDPQAHTVKIDGQKIEGWMEAMTMEYPVKPETEFAKLHVGDRVQATVVVNDTKFYVTDVKVLPKQ